MTRYHEFKVFYDLVSWPNAIDRCVARGASLATIPAPEDDVLSSLTAASWIGLEDMATEGMWRWITGEPLGPTFWDSGEPSDGTFQNCGAAVAEGWHDRACDILLPYLCER